MGKKVDRFLYNIATDTFVIHVSRITIEREEVAVSVSFIPYSAIFCLDENHLIKSLVNGYTYNSYMLKLLTMARQISTLRPGSCTGTLKLLA